MRVDTRLPMILFALSLLGGGPAVAGEINNPTHLTNTGNSAINTIKARQYQTGSGNMNATDPGNAYDPNTDTLVHMGNARRGDCTMNVGGVSDGKNLVVSAKNIVNVCK